jgi:hypothetical protein
MPFAVQQTGMISDEQVLLTMVMGQYDSTAKTQRVIQDATFRVNFSSSEDSIPAYVESVDGYFDPQTELSHIKVTARDRGGSGVKYVIVCGIFTDKIRCQDLRYDRFRYKWMGTFPEFTADTPYVLQVIDGAGNLTYDYPKDGAYALVVKKLWTALPLVFNSAKEEIP